MAVACRAFAAGTVLAAVWLAVVVAAPQSQAVTTTREPSGFLMGQVVDATTGRGMPDATIALSGGKQPSVRLTNSEGQFLFRSLSAGRYQLTVLAPGYVRGSYGQMRPGGSGQPVELVSDDEKRGDLKIRVWKQASLSGRIVDDDGEPVAGCTVRIFRRMPVNGTLGFAMSGPMSGTTDDRGVYRIPELMPGDYLVGFMSMHITMPASTAAAYLQIATSGNGIASSDLGRELISSMAPGLATYRYRVGDLVFQSIPDERNTPPPGPDGKIVVYPRVFHSAAPIPSQASIVTLAPGEDRTDIDLQLRQTSTVRVSGTVTGPEGPVRNLGVRLLPAGAEEFRFEDGLEVAMTATDANGAFTFLGVPPGRYTFKSLRVPRAEPFDAASVTRPPLPTIPTLWATLPINVGNVDVSGLTVALTPGSQISGRLVFEGTSPPPAPNQMVRVSIQIASLSGVTPNAVTNAYKRIDADGQFATVGLPPGKYAVSATLPATGPASWRFKSATLTGRDLAEDGLVIEGRDLSGIVITFTDRGTEVTGTARDEKGQPDGTASVVVLPADSQAWRQGVVNARRFRTARAATTGAFNLTDLPAGSYFIAAISDAALDNWQDPKTLEAITRVATRFTLADGQKLVQNLTTRSIR